MAVTSTNSRVSYTADGVQTAFAYAFEIFTDADLKVYVDGNLQALTSQYTVSGAGSDTGGNVTFLGAPANLKTVLILRSIAQTQTMSLPANDKFPSATVETAIDKLTLLLQQLTEVDNRSLKFAVTSTATDPILPDPVALKILQWDAAGTELQNADMPVGTVGPQGIQGEQGVAGGGAAPTVREVDGAPSVGAITVLEFESADGFIVSEPVAGEARVELLVPIAAGGTGDTTAAGARTALAVPGLAVANTYTKMQRFAKGADIAAAAALTPGTDGNYFVVTGNTTITSIATLGVGTRILLKFSGSPIITYNATTLILQNATNLSAAAGDVLEFVEESAGNWREVSRRLATAAAGGGAGITIGLGMSLPNPLPVL